MRTLFSGLMVGPAEHRYTVRQPLSVGSHLITAGYYGHTAWQAPHVCWQQERGASLAQLG